MAPDPQAPVGPDVLTCRGVHKSFGRRAVLQGVDLTVPHGSILAVLGPSGEGKTTLLRIVAGFERADQGTVELRGEIVDGPGRSVPPERRRIGIVPQESALFPHLSVGENVGFGLPGRRSRRRAASPRVGACLELVGLAGLGGARPHQLSGGQQQRVALARALAPEPSLIMFDEPFSSLDPALRAQVRLDVVAALRAVSSTAVIVTHDQEEALSMADQVAVLLDGRVAQVADPVAIYRSPASLAVATFVGDACLTPADRHGDEATSPLGPLALQAGAALPDRVTAVVRPEQLRVAAHDDQPGAVRARVLTTTFLGADGTVDLAVDGLGTPVTARVDAPDRLSPGEDVWVRVVGPVPAFPQADQQAPPSPGAGSVAGPGGALAGGGPSGASATRPAAQPAR